MPAEQLEELNLLEALAGVEFYGTNTTFPNPPTAREVAELNLMQELHHFTINNITVGQTDPSLLANIRLFGTPGVGKSSMPRMYFKAVSSAIEARTGKPVKLHVIPMASFDPSGALFPRKSYNEQGTAVIEQDLLDDWTCGCCWHVFLFEEPSRGTRPGRNAMLSLLTSGSLGGIRIPNYLGALMTDNEGKESGIVQGPDITHLNRSDHVEVTFADVPWARYFADQFPTRDVSGVVRLYTDPTFLTDQQRGLQLTLRGLEHVLWNLEQGFPAEWGMPIRSGEKVRITRPKFKVDNNGKRVPLGEPDDVTDEKLDQIAAAYGASNRSFVSDKFRTAIEAVVRAGRPGAHKTAYIEGPIGIGKTAVASMIVKEAMPGVKVFHFSAAERDPENDFLPIADPKTGKIELVVCRELIEADVIIIDEIWRAKGPVRNKIMEMLQEGTLCGVPLTARAVIGMNNPRKMGHLTLDTGVPDRAQCDRFFINIQVKRSDVPTGEWLIRTFGQDGEDVLEWWQEEVADEAKDLITARNWVALIRRHRAGRPLKPALTRLPGYYAGEEFLPALVARFDKRPAPRLRALAAALHCPSCELDADGLCRTQAGWVCRLAPSDNYAKHAGDPSRAQFMPEAHQWVGRAFDHAELDQLNELRDAVVELVAVLGKQQLVNLVMRSTTKDKKLFFAAAVREAKGSDATLPAPPSEGQQA